jgi:hypothetical protein
MSWFRDYPELNAAWDRVDRKDGNTDSTYENLKNVASERSRMDPQVTAKAEGFYFSIVVIETVVIIAGMIAWMLL